MRPTAQCPVERALLVLDGRWSVLIIRELLLGPKRFGVLRDRLGISSPKTLTERLRILEHQGVLTRTIYAEVPPRVEYALTERGESFRSVLEAMAAWGEADFELEADPAAAAAPSGRLLGGPPMWSRAAPGRLAA